ncbi:MAG: flagellar motor protein MotA [Candidatus Cloacimonadota bacterium]|nr:MAG: flagellar motor protein MotA [Candidatus Cloacimonadota bacterium]PIE78620.1 MAG: flagellar motor protein MotA [Candidatus Delongbacteria bacterium]
MKRFLEIFFDQFSSQSSLTAGGENVGFFWMWILLAVGIIGLVITLERLLFLFRSNLMNPEKFMKKVFKLIHEGNFNKAKSICDSAKPKLLPQVISEGLDFAKKSTENFSSRDLQDGIDMKMMEIMPKLQARVSYINLIANVATLIGLAGTIFGLIIAFDAVANAADHLKTQQLSSGISAAMGTTIAGLIIAIPMNFFYTFITNKTTAIIDDIDEWSVKFINSANRVNKS